MKTIHESYWDVFTKKDSQGKIINDGEKFEDLVGILLRLMYGKEWERTQVTHDNNRDFWTEIENEIYWAECKNYRDNVSMKILAPTLVMAQVFDATSILFFSRSTINKKAKQKILLYGNKSNRHILFFDGKALSSLIVKYADLLPLEYRPTVVELSRKASISPTTTLSMLSLAKSRINSDETDFVEYTEIKDISLYKIYTLIFTIDNHDLYNEYSYRILFDAEDNQDRFRFEYLNKDIKSDTTLIFDGTVLPGELTTYSIMIRPVIYKENLVLPKFVVTYDNIDQPWRSETVNTRCFWTGESGFVGSKHIETKNNIVGTTIDMDDFSCAVLTGKSGVGKTRTIKECIAEYYKHGYKITSLIASSSMPDIKLIEEIVCSVFDVPKAVVYEAVEQLLNNAGKSISSLLSEVKHAYQLVQLLIFMRSAENDKRITEFIDLYGDYIFNMLASEKRVLLIDDAHALHDEARYFIKKWISYSVNSIYSNRAVAILVYTSDIMTDEDREFINAISHMGIQNYFISELSGFVDAKQSIIFIQQLLRLDPSYDTNIFEMMAEHNDNNPYYMYQAIRLWEEQNLVVQNQNEHGYLIVDERTLEIAVFNMAKEKTLKTVFKTITKKVSEVAAFFRMLSLIFLMERVSRKIMDKFNISVDILDMAENAGLVKKDRTEYLFDHDAVRVFFFTYYESHLLDALSYSYINRKLVSIFPPTLVLLIKICIEKDPSIIVKYALKTDCSMVPNHIKQLYYERLLEASIYIPDSFSGIGEWLQTICGICSELRSIAGSILVKDYFWEAYNNLTEKHNIFRNIYSENLRRFLHSFCDILLQTHDKETVPFIQDVLDRTSDMLTDCIQQEDERNLIRSIMYNRWYNVYNNEKPTAIISSERTQLLELSRRGISKIANIRYKELIEYLNCSDEGYNYYGYKKDIEKLYNTWSTCIRNIPEIVPEKTLNYYRKCIQFDLIEKNVSQARQHIKKGREYLIDGEYRHEPLIFNAFFDTAEILTELQCDGGDYKSCDRKVSSIIMMHRALSSTKVPDLLWIRGILAYYMLDYLGASQYLEDAYRHYEETKLTRNYWIKMRLLKENINNLIKDNGRRRKVSGIIRTVDDMFNLPPIA